MQIFSNIKNSIYSPEYYKEVLQKPMSYSVKYFFKFILILAFVLAVVYSFIFIPRLKAFVDNFGIEAVNVFPGDLKVEIKNGQAFSDSIQPYFIKVPQGFESKEDQPKFDNFIVIDTNNNFDLEKFNSYNTFAILNKDSITYFQNKKITVQPLKDVPNFVADKQSLANLINQVTPFARFIYPIIPVGLFLGNFVAFIFYLLYMIFGALIIWLVLKIKNIKTTYKKSYQLGLHLLTPAIIINTVLGFLGVVFPFLFTIIIIIFTIINIKKFPEPVVTPGAQVV